MACGNYETALRLWAGPTPFSWSVYLPWSCCSSVKPWDSHPGFFRASSRKLPSSPGDCIKHWSVHCFNFLCGSFQLLALQHSQYNSIFVLVSRSNLWWLVTVLHTELVESLGISLLASVGRTGAKNLSFQRIRITSLLEGVQRRVKKVIRGLEGLMYEERSKGLNLYHLDNWLSGEHESLWLWNVYEQGCVRERLFNVGWWEQWNYSIKGQTAVK